MLLSCVGNGCDLNTAKKVKINLCGTKFVYHAWKALKCCHMDESHKNSMVEHYEAKLKDIYLDHDTSATKYINKL